MAREWVDFDKVAKICEAQLVMRDIAKEARKRKIKYYTDQGIDKKMAIIMVDAGVYDATH